MAVIQGGARKKRINTIEESKRNNGKVYIHPYEDIPGFYILNGDQMVFYDKRIVEVDGIKFPGELLTDVWTDISWNGIANEGGVTLKEGKKPEELIRRLLDIATEPNDIVVDFFAGSGTTGAVAHKLERRWIMVEMNAQADELALERLKRVLSGEDQTGISKQVNWQGGGGFRFMEVGASLIVDDPETKLTILNPKYTNGPLTRAVCAIEGFLLTGDKILQGRNSNHYAHVTEEYVDGNYVAKLQRKLPESASLTIYALKFRKNLHLPRRMTIRKMQLDLVKPFLRGENK